MVIAEKAMRSPSRIEQKRRLVSSSVIGIASLFACAIDQPTRPSELAASQHQALPFNPDSVRLRHVCGKRFAVRSANDTAGEMAWAVLGTADSGRVLLPGRNRGQPYSEVYVTTIGAGVLGLRHRGRLIDSTASADRLCPPGHIVPAVAPAAFSASLLDSLGVYIDTRGRRYHRDLLVVEFKPNTPQSDRQAAIDLVRGVVVGGRHWKSREGSYYVRVEPTASIDAFARLVLELFKLPYISGARLANVDLENESSYATPNDGAPWDKKSWRVDRRTTDGANWALEYIDGPLAWGCNTGSVDARIAILDLGFHSAADLDSNIVRTIDPAPLGDHGTRVASVLGARGNNGASMTGIMWRVKLDLVSWIVDTTDNQVVLPLDQSRARKENIIRVARAGARIINISQEINYVGPLGQIVPPDTTNPTHAATIADRRAIVRSALQELALENKHPLVVISAGNYGADAATAGYAAAGADFPDQIIVVGGAAHDNVRQRWSKSNHGALVDVYAPAQDVGVLNYLTGSVVTDSGNSFSTPLVAGTAGLLLSFDNRAVMTAGRLKELILAGAIDSVTEPNGARKPILSAYGGLKRAAGRAGSGTCANRVWLANDSIYVRRDSLDEAV